MVFFDGVGTVVVLVDCAGFLLLFFCLGVRVGLIPQFLFYDCSASVLSLKHGFL